MEPSPVSDAADGAANPSSGDAPAAAEGLPRSTLSEWRQIQRDKRIAAAVRLAIEGHGIDARSIAVTVESGRVRLIGTVNNLLSRDRAIRVADDVRGTQNVTSLLRIEEPIRGDSELQEYIECLLLNDPAVEDLEISVLVQEGKVTLLGEVDTWHERQISEILVMTVQGVKAVENQLDVQKPLVEIGAPERLTSNSDPARGR